MSNFYTEPFVSAGEMEFPSLPYITAQPQNHTATGPEEYILTVIAAGAVSYQWEVFDGESWSTIPGATSDTLTINIDPSMNGWRYRVIVTGADGSTIVSKAAQIAVRGVHEITLEGAIVTFTGPAMIESLKVNITPVQSGSGDPSPTNIRPISGYSSVNVVDCGKNKLQINESGSSSTSGGTFTRDQAAGTITCTGTITRESNTIATVASQKNYPSGTYIFSQGGTHSYMTIRLFDVTANAYLTTTDAETTVTIDETHLIAVRIYIPKGTYNASVVFRPMLRLSGTTSDFEPYNGTTYPISLGSTIYGGTLDVTSGVLAVTHELVTYTGASSEAWTQNGAESNYSLFIYVDNRYKHDQTVVCNILKGVANIASDRMQPFTCCMSPTTQSLLIKMNSTVTPESWKTQIAETNMQVLFELATPTTIQLTPVEVSTLLGQNNIYADCGTIELIYMGWPEGSGEPILEPMQPVIQPVIQGI